METLFSLILWIGLFLLMVQLGRSAHSIRQERENLLDPIDSGQTRNLELRWVAPVKDVDPACGKTVTTAKAKPSVHAGLVYYFCSRECREVFEAAPDLYVGHRPVNRPELEHSHV